MATRRTGMFYLSIEAPGVPARFDDRRLFIGTAEEAFDELKEEVRTLYPDDYSRKDRAFWRDRRVELFLSTNKRTQVVCHDLIKGTQFIRMECAGGWKEEE